MNVRKPAFAGLFYPASAQELQQTVADYIHDSGVRPAPERVVAIVSPHAGYIYSGPTAGFVYARVTGKKPTRVILVGCSHRCTIDRASVFDHGAFETPVGTFPVDEAFARALAEKLDAGSTSRPHDSEHCLEVQLPFLHAALGSVPIVPVLFGGPASPWHAEAGRAIAALADENDLVVASTDLSHYMTDEDAHRTDKRTIDAVLTHDIATVIEGLDIDAYAMCGESAVVAAMAYALARGAHAWTLLDYRTSAGASGDYDRVVGYAGISMERDA